VVKKNTLMVLTHLILNGMIKVKGQLGEMAKCTEDEEPRVSDLAKLFFDELSKKDNSLYNNLQDIISHLSVGQHAVDEDMFERIMKTVFGYIEKVGSKWDASEETMTDYNTTIGKASGICH
jgi:condensin complex subunit 1